ncbi:peroxisomal oxidase [Dendrothele bispora CBS 962.96]|uniref:Acyl-coenzyme A oxidase n=1 Tax=Dendrothele bispora (strain CBS 962.96) TaxID=1314807 RepID=A0A4S8MQB3_DENBC|nr:peroxisomal oxidase [Dendrothele bispora CBS 962.96]
MASSLSLANHDASLQNKIDMSNARKRTTVDVAVMRDFVYNGHNEWLRKEKIIEVLSKDPVFSKEGRDFMTRTEKYNRGLRMINRVSELENSLGWTKEESRLAMHSLDEALPISLHLTAFEPVFLAQASPSLLSTYAPLAAKLGIFGCYLQTELGHGSNVSALETTATYIPETREFEIHSPTLTSSKWWIGALGKTATHGVVQAKLLLPDKKSNLKDMGPHLFFMQLRSLETHKLMPGIIAGDIGPKAFAGFAATDNGFARFDHVRISKENMLSKFAQVSDKGEYIKPPHAKISYGGMLYIRSGMVTSAGWLIARAATISIRYATVRRQGNKGPDGLEFQVITYPSLYSRLMPILARAYVYIEMGRALSRSFNSMSARLATGDTSLLAELHATTSGLKVLCTTASVADAESARRSMGGHGYSVFSGIGRAYADLVPSVTFEGENFVLDQQAARAALKAYRTIFASGKAVTSFDPASLPPSTSYLRLLITSDSQPPLLTSASWLDAETLIVLLEWRAAALVRDFTTSAASEKTDMWNVDPTIYQRVSKAATEAFVAGQVREMFKTVDANNGLGAKEKQVLKKLYLLFLLTTIETSLSDFLAFGLLRMPDFISSGVTDPTRSLRRAISALCKEILPEAIGLTDALGLSDWELDSALAPYDGAAYQALWDRAQTEPLNQEEIPNAYEESIKPMLQRGQKLAKVGAKL